MTIENFLRLDFSDQTAVLEIQLISADEVCHVLNLRVPYLSLSSVDLLLPGCNKYKYLIC